MLPAKSIDPYYLFLIFFCILLADSITIQQFILDIIRIEPFLALLLPPYCLLHHLHDYLLEVIVGHQFSSYAVSVVVVVVLFEEEQFLLGGEGRFHEFYDICEGVIHSHVEVAETEEIGVLCDGDVTVGNTLDQLEDLFFLLIALESG